MKTSGSELRLRGEHHVFRSWLNLESDDDFLRRFELNLGLEWLLGWRATVIAGQSGLFAPDALAHVWRCAAAHCLLPPQRLFLPRAPQRPYRSPVTKRQSKDGKRTREPSCTEGWVKRQSSDQGQGKVVLAILILRGTVVTMLCGCAGGADVQLQASQ